MGSSPRPRVALALGSGGARGYAHIGVINELQERGYQIVGIAGSSMGALVGVCRRRASCMNSPIGRGR
ncbi:patatin-like phospholipase family protein [Mycobacterium xenopi 4042]|uniref:Patatin-like phospholipase family protein n=1 Tax=Mycobacterium xenopi 4042 TaxID=1299334 RepID=X8AFE1_MYCXE|nr:patatin-like phospholipase family protein [Mycobacterium xenopi 4042]